MFNHRFTESIFEALSAQISLCCRFYVTHCLQLIEFLFVFSLHALKDESYIRQTLQRQAATLHHAAVSYSVRYNLVFITCVQVS